MTTPDRTQLHYEYPMFADQTIPHGELLLNKECHACWYYAMLAYKTYSLTSGGIENQIIEYDTHSSDKPLWRNKNYMNLARSTAILYGLESPEAFLKYTDVIVKEGNRMGIQFPMEIFLPWKDQPN